MSQGLSGIPDTNVAKVWHQVASDDSTHRPKAARHFKKSNEHYAFIRDIHMLRRLETVFSRDIHMLRIHDTYALNLVTHLVPSKLVEPISKNIPVTKRNIRERTSLSACSFFNRAS